MRTSGLFPAILPLIIISLSIIYSACKKDDNQTSDGGLNPPWQCGNIIIDERDGQKYYTVQIGDQCWMKENLKIGTMIPGNQEMADNGTIEKYCYENSADSCKKYGGLYQWDELMQYTTQQGIQGICPPGWHVPADEEWKVLEGAVDSQYGNGDPEWDSISWRGYDAGMNLKDSSEWYGNSNGTDLFGFSGLPGGSRLNDGTFKTIGYYGNWYTSTENNGNAWFRSLNGYSPEISRNGDTRKAGLSVRCLKD